MEETNSWSQSQTLKQQKIMKTLTEKGFCLLVLDRLCRRLLTATAPDSHTVPSQISDAGSWLECRPIRVAEGIAQITKRDNTLRVLGRVTYSYYFLWLLVLKTIQSTCETSNSTNSTNNLCCGRNFVHIQSMLTLVDADKCVFFHIVFWTETFLRFVPVRTLTWGCIWIGGYSYGYHCC